MYGITEVNGIEFADEINRFNDSFSDDFLSLKPKHLAKGFWWLVFHQSKVVGFAGMVPFDPFPRVGYLKRAAVLEEHRGKGLQGRLMEAREQRARESTDWTHFVSECHAENVASANNFIRAGFKLCECERPWAKKSLFWIKEIR